MATEGSNGSGTKKVLDIGVGKVQVFEVSGKDASELIKQLVGGEAVELPMRRKQQKLTKNEMVPAFGNYIDDGITSFITDMMNAGSSQQEVFEAIHMALSHHVGASERSIAKVKMEDGGTGGLGALEDVRENNIIIGWEHRSFHIDNPGTPCPDNPYKVGEPISAASKKDVVVPMSIEDALKQGAEDKAKMKEQKEKAGPHQCISTGGACEICGE